MIRRFRVRAWHTWSLGLCLLSGCAPSGGPVTSAQDNSSTTNESEARVAPLLPASVEEPPPEIAFPDIPQDSAAQQKARAEEHRRLRTELTSAYERFGQNKLTWYGPAREALESWARFQVWPAFRDSSEPGDWYTNRFEEVGVDQLRAWRAARRAVELGCNDPLIHYLLARLSYGECAVDNGVLNLYWTTAVTGMRASKYPASLKAFVYVGAGEYLARQNYNRTDRDTGAERLFDEATALIPAVTREYQGRPDRSITLYHLGALLVEGRHWLPGEKLEGAHAKVVAAFSVDPANEVERLLITGDTMCRLAWQFRGRGTAAEVSPDDWDRFDSRLARAEEALTAAWNLEPTCVEIPHLMICIETYLDRGRDRMEEWFEKAMRLNGDDYVACVAKLEYLEPRWHGSEAEMLAFGRSCLRTHNWPGRLPFVLLEAHRRLARYSLIPAPTAREAGYFTRRYVWKDIQSVYEPYLAFRPDSNYDKSCYARLAALGGHYEVANRLFDDLGPNLWHSIFGPTEYLRLRTAAKEGRIPEFQPIPHRFRQVPPPLPRVNPTT